MIDIYLGLLKSCNVCSYDLMKTECPDCSGSGNAGEWAEDEWCSTCHGNGDLWWCENCKHERWPKPPDYDNLSAPAAPGGGEL